MTNVEFTLDIRNSTLDTRNSTFSRGELWQNLDRWLARKAAADWAAAG